MTIYTFFYIIFRMKFVQNQYVVQKRDNAQVTETEGTLIQYTETKLICNKCSAPNVSSSTTMIQKRLVNALKLNCSPTKEQFEKVK